MCYNNLKKCVKICGYRNAKKVPPGTIVYNDLEKVHYVTGCKNNIIVTGILGEQWVMTEKQFEEHYLHANKKVGFFEFATKEQCIITANGDKLNASVGDAIVCSEYNGQPNLSDRWVVNKVVFAKTYKILD